jgi:hypothetical protein
MANNQIVTAYDDAGYPATATRTSAVTAAGTFTVKQSPGRVVKVVVTTSASGAVTIYDNASAGSGTVLWASGASPALGVSDVNLPAVNGITVVAAATPSNVTIGYA